MGGNDLFSDQELKKMIVPLFLEQLLVMLVGLADTLVISYAGESAVSGVSLVNQFNTIFIYLFTALASGGAVVISQYIGRQDTDLAGESWKNKCDDVPLSSVQCDQCHWQCDRCFCFSRRGSRCCMAVLPCPCFFRSGHHFSLLSGKEQGGV